MKINKNILNKIKKSFPKKIAEEIVSIQPIDPKLIGKLREESMSEENLINQGYEPIDNLTKLVWRKKNNEII